MAIFPVTLTPRSNNVFSCKCTVLCLGQDFLETQVSLYLNFRGTFTNSGGHTKSSFYLAVKLNSYLEFLFIFYLNLSLMSIVLAQEGV